MSLYGGRSFVSTLISGQLDPTPMRTKRTSRALRVLSYNVFSDAKCSTLRYTTTTKWDRRCHTIIEEIRSYEADVVCFQDLDHFDDYWRVQLMVLGYDSVFKKRTQTRDQHYEGVAIAYKRDLFQLFKSVPVNLNDAHTMDTGMGSGMSERLVTDDVALLLLLQPWAPDFLESALLVATCQFSSREGDFDVRFFQAQHLTRQIELANREFHLPVVLGCALHDTPNSAAYHVLRTGRRQLKPKAPGKVRQPFGKGYCRGSVRLNWYAPKLGKADPAIHAYRIAWRPGGSLTLGFREQIEVQAGATVQYGERVNAHGIKKTYVMEELAFNVTGLSSELPFEFIVCAVNEVGQGLWSDPSMPVVMINPPKEPRQAPLKYLRDVNEVGLLREQFTMCQQDWDVEQAINSDPVKAPTQLTPRTIMGVRDLQVPRGRVLPLSVNPREGWREDLRGQSDPRVVKELSAVERVYNTALRIVDMDDPLNFQARLVDSPRSKRAILPVDYEDTPFDPMGRPKAPAVLFDEEGLLWGENDDDDDDDCGGDEGGGGYGDGDGDGGEEERGGGFGARGDGEDDGISLASEGSKLSQHSQRSQSPRGDGDAETKLAPLTEHSMSPKRKLVGGGISPAGHSSAKIPGSGKKQQREQLPPRLSELEQRMRDSGIAKKAIALRITKLQTQLQQLKADNDDISLDSFDSKYRRVVNVALGLEEGSRASGSETKGQWEDDSALSPSQERQLAREAEISRIEAEIRATEETYQSELQRLTTLNLTALRDEARVAQRLNDDTLLDGAETVLYVGRADPRQTHNLFLRSAYENYSSGGEPLFTQSFPANDGSPCGVACSDYIFYSAQSMYAEEVLSLPCINQLRGDNPQCLLSRADPYWKDPPPLVRGMYNKHLASIKFQQPSSASASATFSKQQIAEAKRQLEALLNTSFNAGGVKDKVGPQKGMPDKKEAEVSKPDSFWAGIWLANPSYNPLRSHFWLPNDTFVSSHLALAVSLQFIEGQVATLWK